ncbi:MAG: serine kinase of the HPr protein regulates carbohydrate metabolism, partial [Steroidobacteraceae bacterium]|nr:serine kinase of the HPr protein regulates carbohydrate metabolism [Steroidobacteraceae bacterium]
MEQADQRLRPGSAPDPFGERPRHLHSARVYVLGGSFEFESSSRALLRLVAEAYAGLPRHRLTRSTPRFKIRLQVTRGDAEAGSAAAPPAHLHGGAGLLSVVMDAANFAVICPAERSGLVAISRTSLLRFPRLVRYELLEFAVFALAHRGLGLVSLHAGCVGWQRRGLLLIGESGAGKSTLALHGAHRGLDFLTEDATFVDTSTMLATGVSNFLHLKADALRYLDDDALTRRIGKSPIIRRRSGVEKLDLDMRRLGKPLAAKPVTVAGIAFLSMTPVGKGPLLRNVKRREL